MQKSDSINVFKDFYITGAKLCNKALRFSVYISDELFLAAGGRDNIIELGAIVLPLQLSHGKDMFLSEPIYSNENYAIRGYSNFRRKNGEYTYNDDAILTTPSAILLESTENANEFVFFVSNIEKEDYYTFFGAECFIRYKAEDGEKIIYSHYYQINLYSAALSLLEICPNNDFARSVVDYCENERRERYIKENYTNKRRHIFTAMDIENLKVHHLENGLVACELEIDWYGSTEKNEIVHLTDAHLNYINRCDTIQNDPAVMSTYEHRIWCCNGATVPQMLRVMEYASFSDKIVLTGDMMDYFSHGCYQLIDRICFGYSENTGVYYNDFPKVVATLGNHELVKQMEGVVPQETTEAEHYSALQKYWPNDMTYHSEVVRNKFCNNPVKIILLDNSHGKYLNTEIPKNLSADIADARLKNIPVFLFQHVPLYTGIDKDFYGLFNPKVIRRGALSACRPNACSELDAEVYKTITDNADIICGVFCGHWHDQFYSEIIGTGNANGYVIPQYVTQSCIYGNGFAFKITVK